jgi:chromosome partitioning protein
MTRTITISNEKGGVAKTTSTLSVGAALAEMDHRVLLVDLDPQANLTLALGFEPGEAERTAADVLLDSLGLMGARRSTDVRGLDLIPGSSRIEAAEQFLPVRAGYSTIFRRAIQAAGPLSYDYILIDCPPSLGSITTNDSARPTC